MKYKTIFSAALLTAVMSTSANAEPTQVMGQWYTFDDETGKRSSLITLSQDDNGKLVGQISKILKEVEEGVCDKCPEPFTDVPVEGLQFMWGFSRAEAGLWEGGKLLDPESGDIYKGKVELLDNPDQLEVRGYIGISLFGRSQIWQRAPQEEVDELLKNDVSLGEK